MSDLPPISQTLSATPISKFMQRQVFYAMKNTSIVMAMKTMVTHSISGLPVVDNNGTCLGVYSELDAILQGASQTLDSHIKFTSPPLYAHIDDTFKDVLVLIIKKRIKRLPVLDGAMKLVGVVSRRDLVKAFLADLEAHK